MGGALASWGAGRLTLADIHEILGVTNTGSSVKCLLQIHFGKCEKGVERSTETKLILVQLSIFSTMNFEDHSLHTHFVK